MAIERTKTVTTKENRYSSIIAEVFRRGFKKGSRRFAFDRKDFAGIAASKGIELPKNLGDTIYSFKYRAALPESILKTAPEGFEWIISGAGSGKYEFRLVKPFDISPQKNRLVIKIPDATPEIIGAYALGDEQALLAKVRYNRLIDIFLGISASSLQNHLRTTVKGIGQIEIDELYVGLDRNGCQYVVPVQAKGGKDKHGRQQTEQDIACCIEKFPLLECRPVSAQFVNKNKIAMFELTIQEDEVKIVAEEHYELVDASDISESDLKRYARKPRLK
ncbi:MAG: endonuclease [Pseudoxanthomonas sp.]